MAKGRHDKRFLRRLKSDMKQEEQAIQQLEDHLQAQEQTPAQPGSPADPKSSVKSSGVAAAAAAAAASTSVIMSPDIPRELTGAQSGSDKIEADPLAAQRFGPSRELDGDVGQFGPEGLDEVGDAMGR